jgi:hypothetical protein
MNSIPLTDYPWISKATRNLYNDINGSDEYERGAHEALELLKERRILPSRCQIDDIVDINFQEAGVLKNARIIKVHFTKSKTLYDVELTSR